MRKLRLYSILIVLVISFCCYGDVQSEIDSGWQDMYRGNFTQARNIITNIISSDASSVDKASATLRLGWVDVFEAIANGQYAQAKTTVDSLKTQYAGNESLGLCVFRTAERMEWDDQLDIAKELYGDAKLLNGEYSAKATWHEVYTEGSTVPTYDHCGIHGGFNGTRMEHNTTAPIDGGGNSSL